MGNVSKAIRTGIVFVAIAACAWISAVPMSQAQAYEGERSIKLSALAIPQSSQRHFKNPSLFGTTEVMSANIQPFTKWTGVMARYQAQMVSSQSAQFKAWYNRMAHLKDVPLMQKLRQVNNIVNLNRYVEDQYLYGQSDYWATPIEFIAKQAGDCEDFAIAKMMTLKALGVPESSMRIAVVQDTMKNIPHAILIVYSQGNAYILDNQIKEVVPTQNVAHYKPYYSISRTAWWRHSETTKTASLR